MTRVGACSPRRSSRSSRSWGLSPWPSWMGMAGASSAGQRTWRIGLSSRGGCRVPRR